MSAFIAAVVEAWAEFRVQKTRILLSLIGVAMSVAVLTSIVGVGNLARESMQQSQERQGGRAATLSVHLGSQTGLESAAVRRAFTDLAARYKIQYSSVVMQTQIPFQFPTGVTSVQSMVVDPAYGAMHRLSILHGHWFAADDEQRLAPAVVVSQAFYSALGSPDLVASPIITIAGERSTSAVVIGVLPDQYPGMPPAAYMLPGAFDRAGIGGGDTTPGLEVWSAPESVEALSHTIASDLAAVFPGAQVSPYRADYAAHGDPFAPVQLIVVGIAAVVMLLGAMGLLNISMVTVRYRVREIGIRRSFGATGGRVFFGVLMESVVATTLAGIVGVMIAVAVVKNPWLEGKVAPGLTEFPAFPVEAALLGLGSALLVGALAGVIPALVAVRVKVIDAIRF